MAFENFWFSSGSAGGGGGGDEGEAIGASLRFRNSQELRRTSTPAVGETFTISFWTKLGTPPGNSNSDFYWFSFGQTDSVVNLYMDNWTSNSGQNYIIKNAGGSFNFEGRYRDYAAWYHIVWRNNGGTSTMWVNGQQRLTTTATMNITAGQFTIGANNNSFSSTRSSNFTGYQADWYFMDGLALTPECFGRENDQGIWVPREGSREDLATPRAFTTADYGDEGFHLDFHDVDNLGEDVSGNNNDFTPQGFETVLPKNPQWQTYTTDWGTRYTNQPVCIFSGVANSSFEPPDWYFLQPSTATITGVLEEAGAAAGDTIVLTVYPRNGTVTCTMNGSTSQSTSGNGVRTITINVPAGGLTSCTVNGTDGTYWGIGAISVDGVTLTNYGSGPDYDYMTDTPTQNFSTLNPLGFPGGRLCNCITGTNAFLSATASSNPDMGSTIFQLPTGGRYAWQIQGEPGESDSPEVYVQFYNVTSPAKDSGATEGAITCEFSNGDFRLNAGLTPGSPGIASGTGSQNCTLQILVDCDTQNMWVGNMFGNFLIQDPVGGSGTMSVGDFDIDTPTLNYGDIGEDGADLYMMFGPTIEGINYGQHPYLVTLPDTSFLPLQTQNMPTPTILNGRDHFGVLTYNGNSGGQSIGTDFVPGLIWFKTRGASNDHLLIDRVRGGTSGVCSNDNAAATTSNQYITNFDDNGSIVTGTATQINDNNQPQVAWYWRADETWASTDDDVTAGTRASNGRRDVAAGFSIVSFEGTSGDTIAHGLNQRPELILDRDLENEQFWRVFHYRMDDGETNWDVSDNLHLDLTDSYPPGRGAATRIDQVRDTFFRIAGGTAGADRISYCWHSVPGYCSIGSYEGNDDTNGPFIYTGFRPAFIIYKNVDASGSWVMHDTRRSTTNPVNLRLMANSESDEGTSTAMNVDILSNGFKHRNEDTDLNGSNTYVYAAWAENPFGGENTAPVTAR